MRRNQGNTKVSGEPFDPFDELRAGRLRTLRAVSGKSLMRQIVNLFEIPDPKDQISGFQVSGVREKTQRLKPEH